MTPPRIVALAALVVAGACAEPTSVVGQNHREPAPFPVTLTDDEGVEVTLDEAPSRIVTFAPSHTEIVYALGAGDRLVGVSGSFDDFPAEAQDLPPVAGPSGTEPNVEKVVGLEADIVLTAFIGGAWKDRLREVGVPVFTTLASDVPDAIDDIVLLGRAIGEHEEAASLALDLERQARDVEASVGAQRVTCFLELSDLFTVGPGSLEYDLLERAGCDPITSSASQPYPQWSIEQLVQEDPDVFLASETGQPIEEIVDRPGIRDLTAVREGRTAVVSGDLISRPGPRIVEGMRVVSEALHA